MGSGWEERARELLDRFELGGAADRVTASFSHGMGRRLSVVIAAFHRPPVLLFDEPFDPAVESIEVRVLLPLLLANAEGLVALLDELPTRHVLARAILRPGTQWWQLVAALGATRAPSSNYG